MSVIYDENGRPSQKAEYEWKSGVVNVAGATADTNLKSIAGFTTLFDTLPKNVAHKVTVEASGAAYIRLNSATNDIITIGATTPFTDNDAVCNKIFVTTGGAGITITVKLK